MLEVIWSILGFLIAITLLVAVHEYGHFFVARRLGVKVLRFSIGFGKPLWKIKDKKGCEYVIAMLPLGGYVKMLDEREAPVPTEQLPYAFNRQSVSRRIAIASAGPLANVIFAIVAFWVMYTVGIPGVAPVINKILPDSPAAQAGLQAQDEIIAVNKTPVTTMNQFIDIVWLHPDQDLAITVSRAGQQQQFTLHSKKIVVDDMPHGQIGVVFAGPPWPQSMLRWQRYPIYKAWWPALQQTWLVTKMSFVIMGKMVVGDVSLKNISGPIGIAEMAGQTLHNGFVAFVSFLALVSISLAIVNILPIPILDGGHILYALIEKIRKKPLSERAQELGFRFGVIFLLCLMLLAVINDINRF